MMGDAQEKQMEPEVKSGYGVFFSPVRWLPYKRNSQQFKSGRKGRWQQMNEYGGWHNCEKPWVICQDPEAIVTALEAK